jgi:hypothetical protein
MTRKFKLFGVMAVAALALTAVAASAAQAAPAFHVETAPATITGEQTTAQEFGTNSGVVTCSGATFHGTSTVTETTTQEVTPTYTGCKAFGFLSSTVEPNGCGYLFHLVAGGVSPYPATVDVVCPSGKAITVKSVFTNCVITVGAQTGLEGVTFTNTGTKTTRDLDVSLTLTNEVINGKEVNNAKITYTQTGSNCAGGEGTFTNGSMKGGATVKADNTSTGLQQGLFIS